MRLTKKKAIEISIELWEWLAETGSEWKGDWPGWDKYGRMGENCALCEYAIKERSDTCGRCPYFKMFGTCDDAGQIFPKWGSARTTKTKGKYAALFLEQLRAL